MLITPAAAALLLSSNLRWVLFLASLIGVLSGVIGLLVAIWLEIAPGPAMAVVATLFYVLAGVLSPQRGLFARWRNKLLHRYKIAEEDLLKFLLKKTENQTEPGIEKQFLKQAPIRNHKFILQRLLLKALVKVDENNIYITDKGKQQANLLVRAHRLWETYLVNQIGLTDLQIHNDAEKLEHILPEELLDEVERSLGYPELDPHGSLIPLKTKIEGLTLCDLNENESAGIKSEQMSEHISAELWNLGLVPGARVLVKTIEKDSIVLQHSDKEFSLSKGLARVVKVER
jgi:Mn-dependent DtxR family transcriptional regulator